MLAGDAEDVRCTEPTGGSFMIGLEKRYLKTRFDNIDYMAVGANAKPPVLFVHGIPT